MGTGLANPFDDRPDRLRGKVGGTIAALVLANLAAAAWALTVFAEKPALLGTALLAWALGLRHAFDADHIAAIDNVVRKLMQQGKQPFSVGFFFSLGHSTVVVLASIAVALAATALKGKLETAHSVGGVIGTTISALFLLAVGLFNLVTLRSVWQAFTKVRRARQLAHEDLETLVASSGLLARLLRPVFGVVSRSWHMYPVGFLFGLGFDTATEIGLLGISAAQAAQGMSFWSLLVFPALFAAGMSLMDLADSAMMTGVYGWAFVHPVRKLWYNLTITAASAVVAIFIGGVEALGLVAARLGSRGGLWGAIGALSDSLASLGFGVVGIFMAAWALSAVIYRARGYDRIAAG